MMYKAVLQVILQCLQSLPDYLRPASWWADGSADSASSVAGTMQSVICALAAVVAVQVS